ncbi:hypothetical protein [Virgibacillus sp. DJP39]|uniref:hypothetical protein n=1 Tax=Virgibacillus sp. DJP39 TaxID=3409790 RepID=UPI003BB6BBF9
MIIEWISLTHGLLYYYGVAGISVLIDKVEQLTGQDIDGLEFIKVMSFAEDYHGQVELSGYGLHYHKVFNASEILKEQQKRQGTDYIVLQRNSY